MTIQKQAYLKDPCGSSSLPYWKMADILAQPQVTIVHERDFHAKDFAGYRDQRFFRLIHHLQRIDAPVVPKGYYVRTISIPEELDRLVDLINQCYQDISVNRNQMLFWTASPVFDPHLWVGVCEESTSELVGAGIAEIDDTIQEGILEWIQVLPKHQQSGIGQCLVRTLLERLKGKVDFVTVSGDLDNPTNPEKLYRSTGFTGNDIWHILTKQSK